MCRAVNCKSCNKTTWSGCGNHVDAVMASVPKADRCSCSGKSATAPAAPATGNWLTRLFGQR